MQSLKARELFDYCIFLPFFTAFNLLMDFIVYCLCCCVSLSHSLSLSVLPLLFSVFFWVFCFQFRCSHSLIYVVVVVAQAWHLIVLCDFMRLHWGAPHNLATTPEALPPSHPLHSLHSFVACGSI